MKDIAAMESGIELKDNEFTETSTETTSYQNGATSQLKDGKTYIPVSNSIDNMECNSGFIRELVEGSLSEYHGLIEVDVAPDAPFYKKIWAYLGPGALIAVGYMDPGNWSTDIAGGSAYGYKLLFIDC